MTTHKANAGTELQHLQWVLGGRLSSQRKDSELRANAAETAEYFIKCLKGLQTFGQDMDTEYHQIDQVLCHRDF